MTYMKLKTQHMFTYVLQMCYICFICVLHVFYMCFTCVLYVFYMCFDMCFFMQKNICIYGRVPWGLPQCIAFGFI